jgi:subtilisin family serine protease
VEWVARHSRTIDVANMSFSDDEGSDSETCGLADGRVRDPLHLAICTGTARGVVFVAAAGNEAVDVAAPTRQVVPAAYDEVITVSAYADYDGSRRGVGANTCGGEPHFEEDDTLAFFSNFGRDVDLAAPGVCILSTFPGGQYGVADGTSFAAPIVAGAAALIKARDPRVLTPQVNARLRALGEPGPLPQDPDGFPEPLLDIGTL